MVLGWLSRSDKHLNLHPASSPNGMRFIGSGCIQRALVVPRMAPRKSRAKGSSMVASFHVIFPDVLCGTNLGKAFRTVRGLYRGAQAVLGRLCAECHQMDTSS